MSTRNRSTTLVRPSVGLRRPSIQRSTLHPHSAKDTTSRLDPSPLHLDPVPTPTPTDLPAVQQQEDGGTNLEGTMVGRGAKEAALQLDLDRTIEYGMQLTQRINQLNATVEMLEEDQLSAHAALQEVDAKYQIQINKLEHEVKILRHYEYVHGSSQNMIADLQNTITNNQAHIRTLEDQFHQLKVQYYLEGKQIRKALIRDLMTQFLPIKPATETSMKDLYLGWMQWAAQRNNSRYNQEHMARNQLALRTLYHAITSFTDDDVVMDADMVTRAYSEKVCADLECKVRYYAACCEANFEAAEALKNEMLVNLCRVMEEDAWRRVVEGLKEDIDTHKTRIEILEIDVLTSEDELELKNKELSAYSKSNSELKKELASLQEIRNIKAQEIRNLEQTMSTMIPQDKYEILRKERDVLFRNLEEIRQTLSDVGIPVTTPDAVAELLQLEFKLKKSVESDIKSLRNELTSITSEKSDMEVKFKEASERITQLIAENVTLQSEVTEYKQNNSDLEMKLQHTSKELIHEQQSHSATEYARIVKLYEEERGRVIQLECADSSLRTSLEALKTTCRVLENELEVARGKLTAAEGRLKIAEDLTKEQSLQLISKTTALTALESQCHAMSLTETDLRTQLREVEKLASSSAADREALQNVTECVKTLERLLKQARQEAAGSDELHQKISQLESENAELRSKQADGERDTQELQLNMFALKNRADDATKEKLQTREEVEWLQRRVEELETALKGQENSMKSLKIHTLEHQRRFEEAQIALAGIARLEKERDDLKVENKWLSEHVEALMVNRSGEELDSSLVFLSPQEMKHRCEICNEEAEGRADVIQHITKNLFDFSLRLTEDILELSKRFETQSQEMVSENSELKNAIALEREDVESKLNSAISERDALRNEIERLEACQISCESYEIELKSREKMIETSAATVKALEDTVAKVNHTNDVLNRECKDLRSRLQHLTDICDRQQQLLARAQSRRSASVPSDVEGGSPIMSPEVDIRYTSLQEERNTLAQKLSSAQLRIDELEDNLAKALTQQKKAEASLATLDHVIKVCEEANDQCLRANSEVMECRALREECNDLKIQLIELREEHNFQIQKVRDVESVRDMLHEAVRNAENDRDIAIARQQLLQSRAKAKDLEVECLTQRIVQLERNRSTSDPVENQFLQSPLEQVHANRHSISPRRHEGEENHHFVSPSRAKPSCHHCGHHISSPWRSSRENT